MAALLAYRPTPRRMSSRRSAGRRTSSDPGSADPTCLSLFYDGYLGRHGHAMIIISTVVTAIRNIALVVFTIEVCRPGACWAPGSWREPPDTPGLKVDKAALTVFARQ